MASSSRNNNFSGELFDLSKHGIINLVMII